MSQAIAETNNGAGNTNDAALAALQIDALRGEKPLDHLVESNIEKSPLTAGTVNSNATIPKVPNGTANYPSSKKKNGKLCNFEGCTKYKQSGCFGFCLTHVKCGDPTHFTLQQQMRAIGRGERKKNKRYLCKWDGCERYIQSNCNGYCLTHVKIANFEEEDDENVMKVRVRLLGRLQNGFCRAFLPFELRESWGFNMAVGNGDAEEISWLNDATQGESESIDVVNTECKPDVVTSQTENDNDMVGEDREEIIEVKSELIDEDVKEEEKTAAAPAMETEPTLNDNRQPASPQTQPLVPALDFKIDANPQRKANGATKCKAVGCPKNSQSHAHGFCRAHHNRYLICTGQCTSWDCVCGEKIASFRDRCGRCHRWRGGRQGSSVRKEWGVALGVAAREDGELMLSGKRKRKPSDRAVSAAAAAPPWECMKCRISNPGSKRRCGGCLTWKGVVGGGGGSQGKSGGGKRCGGRVGPGSGGGRNNHNLAAAKGTSSSSTMHSHHMSTTSTPMAMTAGGNGSWRCKECSFDNLPGDMQCFMCREKRQNWQWLQSRKTAAKRQAIITAQTPQSLAAAKTYKVAPSIRKGSFISSHPKLSSATEKSAEYNYFGHCSDVTSYTLISIHYNFNQAFYENHDYSYLNDGIKQPQSTSSVGGNAM